MLKTLAGDIDGAMGDGRQNRFDNKISKMIKSKNTESFFRSGF